MRAKGWVTAHIDGGRGYALAEPTGADRERVTASGEVECTECGHVIERHDPCEMCDCPVRWSAADAAAYRQWLGLPA